MAVFPYFNLSFKNGHFFHGAKEIAIKNLTYYILKIIVKTSHNKDSLGGGVNFSISAKILNAPIC